MVRQVSSEPKPLFIHYYFIIIFFDVEDEWLKFSEHFAHSESWEKLILKWSCSPLLEIKFQGYIIFLKWFLRSVT